MMKETKDIKKLNNHFDETLCYSSFLLRQQYTKMHLLRKRFVN